MNKKQILDYLDNHHGWVLQRRIGIKGASWWSLRKIKKSGNVIHLNFNSASAAAKELKLFKNDCSTSIYVKEDKCTQKATI